MGDEVVSGKYAQSARLLDAIRDRQSALKARASEVLASCGWGLSKDQLMLCDEVLRPCTARTCSVLYIGRPRVRKITAGDESVPWRGRPGQTAILAVRNNRLNEAPANP